MTPVPDNFKWIESIGVLPKMVQEGLKIYGVKEIPGPQNNPEIMKMASEIGVENIYTSDDKQAWCAVAHCAVALRAGKNVVFTDKYDYLRAKAFAKQGVNFLLDKWEVIERVNGMFGDTVIFERPGGGHLGLYIGESKTHIYVMGGNQQNQYCLTRVAKERLYAIRRPKYNIMPPSVKKYFLNDTGTPATSNEQ